jgi:cytochrome c oxidase assembly protein subunit 15
MILVGGHVRLNKAGLSMIRWDLHKNSPPTNNEDWLKEFNEYKKEPQYKNDFPNMTLPEFKKIYLLEFYHRQLGKALGIVFTVPLVYFISRGYLKRRLMYTLLSLLGVGSLQGFFGWWMVRSGLSRDLGKDYKNKDVKVAPYRLAVHFTTAVILFGILFNSSLFLIKTHPAIKRNIIEYSTLKTARHAFYGVLFWNFLTLVTGSLMAGNNAGKITNTFPKIGDVWIPNKNHFFNSEKFNWFRDLLENQFIVHFNHRAIATFYLSVVLLNFYKLIGMGIISKSVGSAYLTFSLLSILQYCLGIINVFSGCKLEYAQTHQFVGILTFAVGIFGISFTKKANPKQMEVLFKKLMSKDRLLLESKLKSFKRNHPQYYNHFFDSNVKKLSLNV